MDGLKVLNITLDDDEWVMLVKAKGNLTWRKFILKMAGIKAN